MINNRLYEYYKQVLKEYRGPGGAPRYDTEAEAVAARRLYNRAYQNVYSRSVKGRAASRSKDHRRRLTKAARERGGDYLAFTKRMLAAGYCACFYCEIPLSNPSDRTVDHVIPLAKGGTDEHGNLVVACRSCNSVKSDKNPLEFLRQTMRVKSGWGG